MISSWHPTTRAALWMGGALFSLVAMALAARHLSASLSIFQILFFRSVLGLLIIVVLLQRYGWHLIKTRQPSTHIVRNVSHFGAQYAWIYGIGVIPMAHVFAIEFTVPVWTAIFATFLLGERMTWARVLSVGMGLIGVFLIVRPDRGIIHPAALAVLVGSFGFSVSYIMTKRASKTDSPLCILFYMSLIQLVLGLVPSVMHWQPLALSMLPMILLVGTMGLITHYCLTRAMVLADATVVVPLDFLRLPLIAVVGAMFYGEPIEAMLFVGAMFILCGNLFSILVEGKKKAAAA